MTDQNMKMGLRQGMIPFAIGVAGLSFLLFLYLYLEREQVPEVHGLRKEIAEIFGMAGLCTLVVIYGRSVLKIALNEGPLLQRFIPEAYYDLSLSAVRRFLGFLNRTHKSVGAAAVAIFPVHALLMGPAQWNLFLKMVLILLAWQGIFGLLLVVRFPISSLKRYGYLVHAQLFTGVMIAVFAAFGHLLAN